MDPNDQEPEFWASIPDFDYEVSTFGRVRNTRSPTKRLIKPKKIPKGGVVVNLTYKRDGYPMVSQRSLRKLVTEAFDLNPRELPIVIHKDGDIFNCAVDNLVFKDYDRKASSPSIKKQMAHQAMIQGQQAMWDRATYAQQQELLKFGPPVDGVRLKNPDGTYNDAPTPTTDPTHPLTPALDRTLSNNFDEGELE